jgi:hypothetical protein
MHIIWCLCAHSYMMYCVLLKLHYKVILQARGCELVDNLCISGIWGIHCWKMFLTYCLFCWAQQTGSLLTYTICDKLIQGRFEKLQIFFVIKSVRLNFDTTFIGKNYKYNLVFWQNYWEFDNTTKMHLFQAHFFNHIFHLAINVAPLYFCKNNWSERSVTSRAT